MCRLVELLSTSIGSVSLNSRLSLYIRLDTHTDQQDQLTEMYYPKTTREDGKFIFPKKITYREAFRFPSRLQKRQRGKLLLLKILFILLLKKKKLKKQTKKFSQYIILFAVCFSPFRWIHLLQIKL